MSTKRPKNNIPIIPLEVVEYLERQFPPRRLSLDIPDRHIWYQQGQMSVADMLRHVYKRQQESGTVSGQVINKQIED